MSINNVFVLLEEILMEHYVYNVSMVKFGMKWKEIVNAQKIINGQDRDVSKKTNAPVIYIIMIHYKDVSVRKINIGMEENVQLILVVVEVDYIIVHHSNVIVVQELNGILKNANNVIMELYGINLH